MNRDCPRVGVKTLCELFGKTRHAYYDKSWNLDVKTMEHAIVLKLVNEIRVERPETGTSKLYEEIKPALAKHSIKMGRDMLNDLLSDYGLLIRRKRRKARTTMSNHWLRKYPNLIENIVLDRAEQLWVSDITYISLVNSAFCYLSLITDAYSKKIMGYCLYKTLEHIGCLKALEMAFSNRAYSLSELIHHSDRGVQYCCLDYVNKLQINNVKISMTESGSPYENAIAERVNGILKQEFKLAGVYKNIEVAQEQLEIAIKIYNTKRLHASCDFLTPEQAHGHTGKLRKRWKSRNTEKVF